MNNLVSILMVVIAIIGILKLFVFKKKKSMIKRRIGQFKLITILLITGMIYVPATILFCATHPEKTIIYGAKMGLVALRVKSDVSNTLRRADNKLNNTLNPYTPRVGKEVLKVAKNSYNRYGIRDTQRFVAGTGSQAGMNMYMPEPSLFEKIGKGVSNTIKLVCSPIRNLIGFFKV